VNDKDIDTGRNSQLEELHYFRNITSIREMETSYIRSARPGRHNNISINSPRHDIRCTTPSRPWQTKPLEHLHKISTQRGAILPSPWRKKYLFKTALADPGRGLKFPVDRHLRSLLTTEDGVTNPALKAKYISEAAFELTLFFRIRYTRLREQL